MVLERDENFLLTAIGIVDNFYNSGTHFSNWFYIPGQISSQLEVFNLTVSHHKILWFLDPEIVRMDKKILDPDIVEMVQFLDPETAEIPRFLDPKFVKMDQ